MVFITLAWSVRLGLFAILAVAYLSTYPAIQFDQRHHFHLAFLAWLPVGVVLGWAARASISAVRQRSIGNPMQSIRLPGRTQWTRAAAILIAASGVVLAVGLWLRHEQTVAVQRLFDHYLKAAGDEVVVASRRVEGDNIILTISAPARGDQNSFNGRMLRLDIGGPDCASGAKRISAELGGSHDPAHVFKKELVFDFSPARTNAAVFFPAYFHSKMLPALSLVLPRQDLGCVGRATWLRSGELPSLWVLATLYPDWREARLYQTKRFTAHK
jgi:hypothetical protein